jgi:hypothetical protein
VRNATLAARRHMALVFSRRPSAKTASAVLVTCSFGKAVSATVWRMEKFPPGQLTAKVFWASRRVHQARKRPQPLLVRFRIRGERRMGCWHAGHAWMLLLHLWPRCMSPWGLWHRVAPLKLGHNTRSVAVLLHVRSNKCTVLRCLFTRRVVEVIWPPTSNHRAAQESCATVPLL